jgi:serine/threonine protein kinase
MSNNEESVLTPMNTAFKSFNEVFLNRFSIQYEISEELIAFNDSLFRFNHYNKEYKELEELGEGSFGTVFKVLSKDENVYAIKKVELTTMTKINQEKEFLNEFINNFKVKELRGEYVVNYYDA